VHDDTMLVFFVEPESQLYADGCTPYVHIGALNFLSHRNRDELPFSDNRAVNRDIRLHGIVQKARPTEHMNTAFGSAKLGTWIGGVVNIHGFQHKVTNIWQWDPFECLPRDQSSNPRFRCLTKHIDRLAPFVSFHVIRTPLPKMLERERLNPAAHIAKYIEALCIEQDILYGKASKVPIAAAVVADQEEEKAIDGAIHPDKNHGSDDWRRFCRYMLEELTALGASDDTMEAVRELFDQVSCDTSFADGLNDDITALLRIARDGPSPEVKDSNKVAELIQRIQRTHSPFQFAGIYETFSQAKADAFEFAIADLAGRRAIRAARAQRRAEVGAGAFDADTVSIPGDASHLSEEPATARNLSGPGGAQDDAGQGVDGILDPGDRLVGNGGGAPVRPFARFGGPNAGAAGGRAPLLQRPPLDRFGRRLAGAVPPPNPLGAAPGPAAPVRAPGRARPRPAPRSEEPEVFDRKKVPEYPGTSRVNLADHEQQKAFEWAKSCFKNNKESWGTLELLGRPRAWTFLPVVTLLGEGVPDLAFCDPERGLIGADEVTRASFHLKRGRAQPFSDATCVGGCHAAPDLESQPEGPQPHRQVAVPWRAGTRRGEDAQGIQRDRPSRNGVRSLRVAFMTKQLYVPSC
jgi:hypothetical protein